ncbi:MAG: hypothetical protein LBJ57_05585 [Prevotellaceae bacterium]|jgi:hypothetical protein|nr:hypothetical protein [Prevotellaceae bacterium]
MKHTHNIYFSTLLAASLCLSACMRGYDYEFYTPPFPETPTVDQATNYVYETFDDAACVDGQMLMPPFGWTSFAIAGVRTFQTGVVAKKGGGIMRGVMGTGYLSNDTVNDFWLVMPPLDVSDSTSRLTFQEGITYDNDSTKIMLMYSEIYSGGMDRINPSEWVALRETKPAATSSGAVEMRECAPISLWKLGGSRKVVYVAFRYRSRVTLGDIAADNAKRANYYLDNVVFRRN